MLGDTEALGQTVLAALACLDAALDAWYESGGAADPVEYFDQAIAAIRA